MFALRVLFFRLSSPSILSSPQHRVSKSFPTEGTTQRDPAAMPVYALATVPLLESVSTNDTKQAVYADDLISAGQLQPLLNWWENLLKVAPTVGYYPKPSKSWLIVKPEKVELAKQIFKDTKINITSDGQRHPPGCCDRFSWAS